MLLAPTASLPLHVLPPLPAGRGPEPLAFASLKRPAEPPAAAPAAAFAALRPGSLKEELNGSGGGEEPRKRMHIGVDLNTVGGFSGGGNIDASS